MGGLDVVGRRDLPVQGGEVEPLDLPPVLRELFLYWAGIRDGRSMPARRDLDPLDIPALLPWVLLTDVLRNPLDFRYRLVGTGVAGLSRHDYTGRRFSELAHTQSDSVVWQVRVAVVETRRPMQALVPYTGSLTGVTGVASLYLPLSADGRTVDMILCGAVYEGQDVVNSVRLLT
jgi:hypothetical protein